MVEKTTKIFLEAITTSFKKGALHMNRLKDPNCDSQVDIKVGNTTYLDCNELINHYRNENGMLAYTTIELIDTEKRYYYLEIRDYNNGKTLRNQNLLYTILNRNSSVTGTARTW